MEAFSSNKRRFKGIFREVEAYDYKCEALIKITMLFEDIFRGFNKKCEAFQRF
jgi:hypothetical protein